MKAFIDPSLRPIEPPLFDDPSEPYLDESDIPDDCFESELPVNKNIDSTDRILKSRRKKGKMEYLVQWHNFLRNQSTWEPEQNILDKRLIVNFNKSRK
ncbi:unnamed protein product [Porites lobata]|uniref:Chromo domain-containing protein n=1 Tax=Porites lobata TaxID=104759 RepID=A0ABN8R5P3_9CNID|nr:unnamed protein product [Porites lobata]